MIPENALNEEGYIINQGLIKDVNFGKYPSSKNGCGWIALYNLMKILNNETPYKEIIEALTPYIWFKGLTGTRLNIIKKYIRNKGYAMDCSFCKSKYETLAEKSAGGIIYYGTGRSYHFTAFKTLPDGKYHFYNSLYGCKSDIITMSEFKEKRIKLPLTHIIAVKDYSI